MPRFVDRAAAFLTAVCFACVLPPWPRPRRSRRRIFRPPLHHTASGGIINDASSNQFQGTSQPTTGVSVSDRVTGSMGRPCSMQHEHNYATPSISAFALANDGATASAQSASLFRRFLGRGRIIPVDVQAPAASDSTGGRAVPAAQPRSGRDRRRNVFTPAT